MTCLIICFGLTYKPNHFLFCSVYAIKHFHRWMLRGKLSGNISLKSTRYLLFAYEFSWSCSDCSVTHCYWLLSVAHLELLSGLRSYLVTRTVSTYSCLYRSYSSWKACASVTKVNFINQKLTFISNPLPTLYLVFVRFLVKSKLIQMQSQNCDLWSYWSWKKCLIFGLGFFISLTETTSSYEETWSPSNFDC